MAKKPKILALLVAAGSGSRVGEGLPKQYRPIAEKPLLRYSLEAFLSHPDIAGVAVVIAPGHEKYYDAGVAGLKLLPPVIGGVERQDSVKAGLEALAAHKLAKGGIDYVLIHDAARPFLSHDVISRVIAALTPEHGVVPTLPMADTVRRFRSGHWEEVDREGLMCIQTPQGFPFGPLCELQSEDVARFPDDAALWLAANLKLRYVEGEENLRKVTNADDITWAEHTARGAMRTAIGFGYDVHRLVDGTSITLGGVSIPHDKKLDGHSDADVALHALVDAILGALAEGDIGQHFPPSDPTWKGADSARFVEQAVRRVAARGGVIAHADLTIICEAPKISPHRDGMRATIASLLGIDIARVSVKATTTEGLGFTGRHEGIAANAVVTLSLPQ